MLPALAAAVLLQGRGERSGSTGDIGYAEIQSPDAVLKTGAWRAWLDSPGGELPFTLEIARTGTKLAATIGNGEERIAVPETRIEGGEIVFDMPHYDSRITARIAPLGTKLEGEWKKRSGADRWTTLKFHATAGAASRFTPSPDAAARQPEGRWSAHFDKGEETGVLVLRKGPESTVEGTFLMPTGDFRWLAGSVEGDRLRLSCFDGAHAFLFDALAGAQGGWSGRFWSGDRWQDTWTGKVDPSAQLADGFDETHWKEGFGLAELLYPDLNGNERSLGEEAFAGKAIVIQILGSWCPNCHDETAYLARVYDKYKERGLSVVGLGSEMTGEFARDAEQLRRMRERHKAAYPFLLAGLSDKKKAAEAFPALDQVVAFPTTIFLHRDGRVRAVHSGFSGPGTKEEHEKLAKRFEGIIEELLAEPDADDGSTWEFLTAQPWRSLVGDATLRFSKDSSGKKRFESTHFQIEGMCALEVQARDSKLLPPIGTFESNGGDVAVRAATVLLKGRALHLDRRAGVLLDPEDVGKRFVPVDRVAVCSIDGLPPAAGMELIPWLKSPDPAARREAIFRLAATRDPSSRPWPVDPVPLLTDPDVLVRCTAAWACGQLNLKAAEPGLLELTKSGFAGERREAARALRALGRPADTEPIQSLLLDFDPLVRRAAR